MTAAIKILLIDDDDAVIAYLTRKLSPYYDIISTTFPEMATHIAAGEQPDVVLCDIDMPEMGGGEVAAALAANPQTAAIPLIYLTSLVSPEEAKELDGVISGRPGLSKRASLSALMQSINAEVEARAC